MLNRSISVSSDKQQHIDNINIFMGEKKKRIKSFNVEKKKKKENLRLPEKVHEDGSLGFATVKPIGLIFFK